MDKYYHNENYPLEDGHARHVCNHPPKEVYTREEILHFINERIVKYERLAREYPSQRGQFGDKIDELIAISALLL